MMNGYSIADASKLLNLSKEAIRKRLSRGTMKGTKKNNRWIVYIEDKTEGQDRGRDEGQDKKDTVIDILNRQIEYLQQENERKDHIIMNLTNKIPQLTAPREKKQSIWRRLRKHEKENIEG